MLALIAGILFLCGFAAPLPRGTVIDGIDVGGMGRVRAVAAVREQTERELKGKRLTIYAEDRVYTFSFPEIGYRDDLFRLVRTIRKGGNYDSGKRYYLCGKNQVISGICAGESIAMQEPTAEFCAEGAPFLYDGGRDGRTVDTAALTRGVDRALEGGFEPVALRYRQVRRQRSLADVRQETELLAQFSTWFDATNANRASNIRLAAGSINGVCLAGGATLSFNDIVGARTGERGFLPAKIIENGEYTEGYGGGVCQVSTTLYNAALLSGLAIAEYHPHSLAVGYVPPSRDAMVSGRACDLKIHNPAQTPVYIRASVVQGGLTVRIYGKRAAERYAIESVVSGGIVAPEEITEDPALVREGKDGVLSESYLLVTQNGVTRRIFLRKDRYLPQKRVVLREIGPSAAENNF